MMKCEIIRDLIPLYLDKVCSEDSRKLVEEHLAECSECRKYMKELETELEAADRYRRCRCRILYSSYGIQFWIYYRVFRM